jgi:hypothetical protein
MKKGSKFKIVYGLIKFINYMISKNCSQVQKCSQDNKDFEKIMVKNCSRGKKYSRI